MIKLTAHDYFEKYNPKFKSLSDPLECIVISLYKEMFLEMSEELDGIEQDDEDRFFRAIYEQNRKWNDLCDMLGRDNLLSASPIIYDGFERMTLVLGADVIRDRIAESIKGDICE